MAGFRLNTLIRHTAEVKSTATGNHSILALSNVRQFAATKLLHTTCGGFRIMRFKIQRPLLTLHDSALNLSRLNLSDCKTQRQQRVHRDEIVVRNNIRTPKQKA